MEVAGIVAIQIVYAIATLALISIGLGIIYGMMRVINLAHGEFLMLGAYFSWLGTTWGIDFWVSMLIVAPLITGIIGIIVERTIIRFLYGRMMDTMLATWGLSLLLIGLFTTVFGNSTQGLSAPLGSFQIGSYQESQYKLFLIFMAAVMVVAVFLVLRFTKFGLIARATMQNASMAAALGVSPPVVYTAAFGAGAALTGLAGAVLAPVSALFPSFGAAFIAKAFITVIGGGDQVVAGISTSSIFFGLVNQGTTFALESVIGDVALFAAAVVLIRLLPRGITGRFFRRGL